MPDIDAAGRSLTLGEFREATRGLPDNAPIYALGFTVDGIATHPASVDLWSLGIDELLPEV
jgi:hypothetical protein